MFAKGNSYCSAMKLLKLVQSMNMSFLKTPVNLSFPMQFITVRKGKDLSISVSNEKLMF